MIQYYSRNYNYHPAPRAFTLVELLVVIGIMALLISMLLPALNKAIESGKSLQCQSNLRQLGMAMALYQNDNRGSFPFYHLDYYRWALIGVGSDYIGDTSTWSRLFWVKGYVTDPRVYACPSLGQADSFFSLDAATATALKSNMSSGSAEGPFTFVHYGYNMNNIGSNMQNTRNSTNPVVRWVPAKTWELKDPTNTIVLCDTYLPGQSAVYPLISESRGVFVVDDQYNGATWYNADARHSGKSCNVLWADGHASPVFCPDRNNAYGVTTYSVGPGTGLTNVFNSNNHWTRDGRSLIDIINNP